MLRRLVAPSLAFVLVAGLASASIPVVFEENRGQAPDGAAFVARGRDHVLRIEADGATFVGRDGRSIVGLRFTDACPGAVRGDRLLPGVVNDLRGSDPSRWRQGIRTHAAVVRENAWPGIDVVFHVDAGVMEHDFVVSPGADLRSIRLAIEGDGVPCLDDDGALVVATAAGELRFARPVAWEVTPAGDRSPVSSSFVLAPDGSLSFGVERQDAAAPLVIDPVVSFASYLGGSNDEMTGAMAAAPDGDIVIAGQTYSTDFLTVSPHQGATAGQGDAFITRLDPISGTVRWSTYLGGADIDRVEATAFDRFGNVFVGGLTASTDFPTLSAEDGTFNGANDGFVAKLDPSGALLFSTFLGAAGVDEVYGLATNAAGDAFVGGYTDSTSFPIRNARQGTIGGNGDGFLGRLSPDGDIQWMTYHGGDMYEGVENLAVGADGAVTVVGSTNSTNFPVANAAQAALAAGNDAYVSAFSGDGATLQFSTYLGGAGFDFGNAVARNATGDSFVTGFADSPNFPLTSPLDSTFSNGDAFVARFTSAGAVTWSTFLGGTDSEFGNDIGLDPAGNPVIVGNTSSNDFVLASATQATYGGGGDVFVTKLAADGASVLFSTYYGGTDADSARTAAVDRGGFVSFAGITYGPGIPTVAPIQATFASSPPGTGSDSILGTISPGTAADIDADGVANATDTCLKLPNPTQDDRDGDTRGDLCDNCRLYDNVLQADADGDLVGDACEFMYGDVAPLGTPDGTLNVSDVVFALRSSVGLETPTAAQFNAMDVAPYTFVPGPPDVATPAPAASPILDIADVVALLRGSVALVTFVDPS